MDAEDAPEVTPRSAPDRTLTAVLVAVGLLVVVAVIVVLTRGGTVASYAANTPQGVVQRYAQAVVAGDGEEARRYLSLEMNNCDFIDGSPQPDVRVTLDSLTESGDTAVVGVTVTSTYGGEAFADSEYSTEGEFELRSSRGTWLITSTPYELYCDAGN